jgi:hypothetical protein
MHAAISWYSAILTAARLTNTGMSYFYLLLSQLYSLACHPYRFHQHSSHMEANTSGMFQRLCCPTLTPVLSSTDAAGTAYVGSWMTAF